MTDFFTKTNLIDTTKSLNLGSDSWYWYTIVQLDPHKIDISVFTPEEWNMIKTINEYFIQKQECKVFDSDKENPNREINIKYMEKIQWFDNELVKLFGIKFNDLEYDCGDSDEIISDIKMFSKANTVETNKLRKWFISNFHQLHKYYGELKQNFPIN